MSYFLLGVGSIMLFDERETVVGGLLILLTLGLFFL